jgi:protein O-GlcNAc transferase
MTASSEVETLYNEGLAAFQRGDLKVAGDRFVAVLELDPNVALAHNGVGLVLAGTGQTAEALECYDTAIRLDPQFASPHINKSVLLHQTGQLEAALESLRQAVKLEPGNPNANNNLGSILAELHFPQEAITFFDRALAVDPDYPHAAGLRLQNKAHICDWNGTQRDIPRLMARLEAGAQAAPPWALVVIADRPELLRKSAEAWIAQDFPPTDVLGPVALYNHSKIRLGYFSADFHRHATTHLIAELFELHDRAQFEVIAFSFGPETGDEVQQRVRAGVDRFIDVSAKTPREIAELARELEIDIAVDLKGITMGHRMGIFAHRAAPVQVNYLGFPGTTGAPYIDYIVADKVVIPEELEVHYTEEVVTLPYSYQVNDRKRRTADRTVTRAEVGLPEKGFVFCCFNNNFKIIPPVFDVWMRILHAVEGSVLWLLEDNATAVKNLRWEAERRGIDSKRLVFAPRVTPDEHLARQGLADLFLDTYPYNAHTTGSDALWCGLPLLTCSGTSFPSRVGASLLTAVGLPELIVQDFNQYEDLAVALAKDPARLAALRQNLEANRATAPLFNTPAFTRFLEQAYQQMIGARRTKH